MYFLLVGYAQGWDSKRYPTVHRKEIDCREDIRSVAFFVDGKYIVTGGKEGMIRRWRVEDGAEVGTSMVAGGLVYDIVVSGDGKWIVSGTWQLVQVWNTENSGGRSRHIAIGCMQWTRRKT